VFPVVDTAARAVASKLTNSTSNAPALRQRTLTLVPEIEGGVAPWMQALYDHYDDTSFAGYTGRGFGITAGIDYNEAGKGHFGIAFTVYKDYVDETGPRIASNNGHWFMTSPYMGFRQGNIFVNAQMNVGVGKQNMQRTVQIGPVTRNASGNVTEFLAAGGLTGGYVLDLGFVRIVPQVNLNAVDLVQNNYTEQGGGDGVNLAVKERSEASVRAFAGATIGDSYAVYDGHIVPQLFAGWSHEMLTANNTIEMSFASIGSNFTVSGPGEDRSKIIGSGSLSYVVDNWSVGISYDVDIESKTRVQTARMTAALRF